MVFTRVQEIVQVDAHTYTHTQYRRISSSFRDFYLLCTVSPVQKCQLGDVNQRYMVLSRYKFLTKGVFLECTNEVVFAKDMSESLSATTFVPTNAFNEILHFLCGFIKSRCLPYCKWYRKELSIRI